MSLQKKNWCSLCEAWPSKWSQVELIRAPTNAYNSVINRFSQQILTGRKTSDFGFEAWRKKNNEATTLYKEYLFFNFFRYHSIFCFGESNEGLTRVIVKDKSMVFSSRRLRQNIIPKGELKIFCNPRDEACVSQILSFLISSSTRFVVQQRYKMMAEVKKRV